MQCCRDGVARRDSFGEGRHSRPVGHAPIARRTSFVRTRSRNNRSVDLELRVHRVRWVEDWGPHVPRLLSEMPTRTAEDSDEQLTNCMVIIADSGPRRRTTVGPLPPNAIELHRCDAPERQHAALGCARSHRRTESPCAQWRSKRHAGIALTRAANGSSGMTAASR